MTRELSRSFLLVLAREKKSKASRSVATGRSYWSEGVSQQGKACRSDNVNLIRPAQMIIKYGRSGRGGTAST